jgi:hypothetical protein
MIKGVSGVPGSGKTYYVVQEIASKYFTFSKEYSEWIPKDKEKPVTIITNISEFKLNSIKIEDLLMEYQVDIETFLTVPFFEKNLLPKYGRIVLLLDEVQRIIPSNFRNNDVLYFFQYHRHLGIDIYMTYQTWASVSRKVTDLMEFEIRATRNSLKIANEFRYSFYCGMDKIGGTIKKQNKMIFPLYKSFQLDSTEKPLKPVRSLLILVVVLLVGFFVGWKYFLGMFRSSGSADAASIERVEIPKTFPPKEQRGNGGGGSNRPTTHKPAAIPQIEPQTRLQVGGMWYGSKLFAVDYFGQLIPVKDLPFPYYDDYENKKVYITIPDSYLASIKPSYPDSMNRNAVYKDPDGKFQRFGEEPKEDKPKVYTVKKPDYFGRGDG